MPDTAPSGPPLPERGALEPRAQAPDTSGRRTHPASKLSADYALNR